MKKIVLLLLLVGAIGAGAWWYFHRQADDGQLVLHGNVDLRQVDLAFNNSERISEVFVQEGERVERGRLLAALDTGRLQPLYDQAVAAAAAQRQAVDRLHNGSRPEEVAVARANVAAAAADAGNANTTYKRIESLFQTPGARAVSQQDLDNAKAALDVAQARLQVSQKTADLVVLGPRAEDIAQAEAQLRGDLAQAALLHKQLDDARLLAPCEGVIRSRLLEVGDMSSPQKPVFSLAITNPKWIRAYVTETDLGKLRENMKAAVSVDSFPGREFAGWIGFISPIAEFTPKTVETDELRSSLVYEVRVFVTDAADDLRLGMPATVRLKSQPPPNSLPSPGTPGEGEGGGSSSGQAASPSTQP